MMGAKSTLCYRFYRYQANLDLVSKPVALPNTSTENDGRKINLGYRFYRNQANLD